MFVQAAFPGPAGLQVALVPTLLYPSSQVMSITSVTLLGEVEEATPFSTIRAGHVAAAISSIGATFFGCEHRILPKNEVNSEPVRASMGKAKQKQDAHSKWREGGEVESEL